MIGTSVKSQTKKSTEKSSQTKKKIRFEVSAQPYSEVYIAGTFNNWDPRDIKLEEENGDGVYSTYISLPKGKHEYKFIINDVWMIDPDCPDWVPNNHGSLNSIINIE